MTNNSGEDMSRMFLTIGHICWRSLLMLWIKLQISTLQAKLIHLVLSLTLQMMTVLQKTLRMLLDGCLVRMPVNIPDLWLDLGMKIGTKGIQTVLHASSARSTRGTEGGRTPGTRRRECLPRHFQFQSF